MTFEPLEGIPALPTTVREAKGLVETMIMPAVPGSFVMAIPQPSGAFTLTVVLPRPLANPYGDDILYVELGDAEGGCIGDISEALAWAGQDPAVGVTYTNDDGPIGNGERTMLRDLTRALADGDILACEVCHEVRACSQGPYTGIDRNAAWCCAECWSGPAATPGRRGRAPWEAR